MRVNTRHTVLQGQAPSSIFYFDFQDHAERVCPMSSQSCSILGLVFPKTQQTQSEQRDRDKRAIQSWVWELIKVIAHVIRSKKAFPLNIPFLVLNIENNQKICITIQAHI